MFVYRSNRLEELVDELSVVLRHKPSRVLEPELILIQSAGMERYLSRELARRLGILAGVNFPFPRAFLRGFLDRVLGKSDEAQLYERETLSWLLFECLDPRLADPTLSEITSQLRADPGAVRRLYLAEQLAHLFDQYLTYRPEMMLRWEEQSTAEWQAVLWTKIVARLGGEHFARRCQRAIAETSKDQLKAVLPERIVVFGGPGLPPIYLQMLTKMAEATPVHIFALSVSEHYFHDIASSNVSAPRTLLGHPLLASMGQVGGDFQILLENLTSYQEQSSSFKRCGGATQERLAPAAEPSSKKGRLTSERQLSLFGPTSSPLTTLQLLQDSLLDNQLDERRTATVAPLVDESLTVDICHSSLREVETLHERISRWFLLDSSLRPEDIVVMAPNIEDYTALVEAVFAARAGERPFIPFRIFDRSFRDQDPAARVLVLGLKLLQGRFKVSDVLDLLQLEPVRARYEMTISDLERITEWLRQVNIRSGVDAEHRRAFGLPPFDENTWVFGLRRLLLGLAVADDGDQMFDGIVPFDDVSVSDGPLLGRLCEFCEHLFELRESLVAAGVEGLDLRGWCNFLYRLASCLIGESRDGGWDLGVLMQSLYQLQERWALLERRRDALSDNELYMGKLGHAAMLHVLEDALGQVRSSSDFLTSGVTFCSLLPLRNVPFRRVCVLGLNQGQFPRSDPSDPFNLMRAFPRAGDRSLRGDDRYLFLELILSAREVLSLSYVGRSIQDNSIIPPSVVITELENSVSLLDGGARAMSYRNHPLQPFHPSYFIQTYQKSGLVSFDPDYFRGACALLNDKQAQPAFVPGGLPLSAPENEVQLVELIRCFRDPASHFLRNLGVNPRAEGATLFEREPIELTNLERHALGERLLACHTARGLVDDQIELRRGDWPVGRGGTALLNEVSRRAHKIADVSQRLRQSEQERRVLIDVKLSRVPSDRCVALLEHSPHLRGAIEHYGSGEPLDLLLTGSLSHIHGSLRIVHTFGRNYIARNLRIFIEHLALSARDASANEDEVRASVLLCRGTEDEPIDAIAYQPIARDIARQNLSDLCFLRYAGRHFPLPYFPEPSHRFAENLQKERAKQPSGAVERSMEGVASDLSKKDVFERQGAAFEQVYRQHDPLRFAGAPGTEDERQPFVRLAVFIDEMMRAAQVDVEGVTSWASGRWDP